MTRHVCAAVLAAMLAACAPAPAEPPAASRPPEPLFTEAAAAAGLDFAHVNGMTGRFLDPEIFGPGVALFDYDNDADLDVFVVQGRSFDSPGPERGRLYRNDLGSGGLRFTDVTGASGIVADGYGIGVATGDVNNDGWVDLYVMNVGPNQLFLNTGRGTFTDVTARSGTGDPGWSASGTFVDYDRDGWLDLYVANYLTWSLATDSQCFHQTGAPDYCAPTQYRPQPDRLYRNRGNGTFEDVSARVLRGGQSGRGLGVIAGDFTGDGWPDLYVANDGEENYFWTNQRDGTFVNTALVAGLALNANGRAEASMGLDAGDYDNDGDEDIFVTNWAGESNVLYTQVAAGLYEDRRATSGLGPPSVPFTGFGTSWFDFDNDGWLDLFVANGAVIFKEALVRAKDPFPLHEPDHLYRNLGNGRFEEVSGQAGAALTFSDVGRGAAFGDVDNDGDVDVIVGNNNGPLRLLLNAAGGRRAWMGLALVDRHRHRTGAVVRVTRPDGTVLTRRARADGSYGSANDPRVHVGLGDAAAPPRVQVTWPDGTTEERSAVDINRWTTWTQGAAR